MACVASDRAASPPSAQACGFSSGEEEDVQFSKGILEGHLQAVMSIRYVGNPPAQASLMRIFWGHTPRSNICDGAKGLVGGMEHGSRRPVATSLGVHVSSCWFSVDADLRRRRVARRRMLSESTAVPTSMVCVLTDAWEPSPILRRKLRLKLIGLTASRSRVSTLGRGGVGYVGDLSSAAPAGECGSIREKSYAHTFGKPDA